MKFQGKESNFIKNTNQENNEKLSYQVTDVSDKMPQEMKNFCEMMKLPEGADKKIKMEEVSKKFSIEEFHLFVNKITNGAYLDYRNLNHVINTKKRFNTEKIFNPNERIQLERLGDSHDLFLCAGRNPFLGGNPGDNKIETISQVLIFSIENKNFYNWMVSILQDEIKNGKIKKGEHDEWLNGQSNNLKEKNKHDLLKEFVPSKSFFCNQVDPRFLPLFLLNRACIDSCGSGGTAIKIRYLGEDFFRDNGLSSLLFNGNKTSNYDSNNLGIFRWIDMARYIFDPVSGKLYEPTKDCIIKVPEDTFIGNFEDLKWNFEKKN